MSNESSCLSPAQILLLRYLDGHGADVSLPGYFTYDYKVDIDGTIDILLCEEYLSFAPVEFTLSKATVAELKALLKDNGLKATGKKEDLVACICENIPDGILAQYNDKYYQLTEKGKEIVEANDHIHFFHSVYNKVGISIYEADEYRKKHRTLSNVEIGLSILNQKLNSDKYKDTEGRVRGLYCEMAYLCSYGDQKINAIGYYCIVCFMDRTLSENYILRHPDFSPYADGIISEMKSIIIGNVDKSEFYSIYDAAVKKFFEDNTQYISTKYNKNADVLFDEICKYLNLR